MKSWTLIVSYLWKDTWSRWLEQPSSVLSRLFVGALLVTVATLILVAFKLLERNLRARLEEFGVNTLVARVPIAPNDPECLPNLSRPLAYDPLARHGDKVTFRQLYGTASLGWQKNLTVLSYSKEALPILAPFLSKETPLICFSDSLPANSYVEAIYQGQSGPAVVRSIPPLFRPLLNQATLMAPQGWAPKAETVGYIETTLFRREADGLPMARFVESLQALAAIEGRQPPQIHSALGILEELEALQSRQMQWRGAMAGLLGAAVALVFGAIAVLEFRQNAYISALLRSFGTPSKALYIRHWLENAFLANLAALSALLVLAAFHAQLFGMLGFPRALLDLDTANPYLSWEMLLVLLCVNVGAFLSSLSVAIGLKRPVGEILS